MFGQEVVVYAKFSRDENYERDPKHNNQLTRYWNRVPLVEPVVGYIVRRKNCYDGTLHRHEYNEFHIIKTHVCYEVAISINSKPITVHPLDMHPT